MAETKRYGKYPQISRLVRAMSDEGRELVAHWHRVLITALEGYLPKALGELSVPLTGRDLVVGRTSADMALTNWLRVMREVAGIISDPSEADWCCKRGMAVHPSPCPQHGFDIRVLYDPGTVIARPDEVSGEEKAVKIEEPPGYPRAGELWVSITYGVEYAQPEMVSGGWTVVGHV